MRSIILSLWGPYFILTGLCAYVFSVPGVPADVGMFVRREYYSHELITPYLVVRWSPPFFTGGKILGYDVRFTNQDDVSGNFLSQIVTSTQYWLPPVFSTDGNSYLVPITWFFTNTLCIWVLERRNLIDKTKYFKGDCIWCYYRWFTTILYSLDFQFGEMLQNYMFEPLEVEYCRIYHNSIIWYLLQIAAVVVLFINQSETSIPVEYNTMYNVSARAHTKAGPGDWSYGILYNTSTGMYSTVLQCIALQSCSSCINYW